MSADVPHVSRQNSSVSAGGIKESGRKDLRVSLHGFINLVL